MRTLSMSLLACFALLPAARAQYPYPLEPIYPYTTPAPYPPAPAVPAAAPAYSYPLPGYYYPPAPPPGYVMPMPMYPYGPPPAYVPPPAPRRPVVVYQSKPPAERARFFGLGLRAIGLGFNQQIGGKNVILYGGGLELRFRTRGHFALETSLDILHGEFSLNGPIARDSVPFSISALIYIFPNSDERHFNLFFLGGGDVISTTMTLTDETNAQVKQDFTEFGLHLGAGAELRFRWFALSADLRGLALWRYDSDLPAAYYANVDGAPVPRKSYAIQGKAGITFWF